LLTLWLEENPIINYFILLHLNSLLLELQWVLEINQFLKSIEQTTAKKLSL